MSHVSSFALILNNSFKEITEILLEKGEKNYYNSEFLNYSIKINDWYSILYQNIGEGTIRFQINILEFKNLECVTHEINKNFEIHIQLLPKDQILVAFRKKNPFLGWNYNSTIIYTSQS